MTDKIYGRVFDSSTAGWIADLIISGEIDNYEASIGALWNYEAIQDASIAAIVIGSGYVAEASLGNDFYWESGLLEVSIGNTSQDPSINTLFDLYEDVSDYVHNIPQDASIQDLYNEIENIPQDASISDLYSLYEDVSDYAHNIPQDTSISDLYSSKLKNTTDTFSGILTVDGSLLIYGNIYLDGSSYVLKTSNLDVSNNFITLRDGATVQLPDGSIAGLKILKADGTNNILFGTANDAILRIGWEGGILEAIATREDNPTNGYYTYWDDSSSMLKTSDLKGYIDNSLGLRDTSIAWLNANKATKVDSNNNYVAIWNSNGQLNYTSNIYSDGNGPYLKNTSSSNNYNDNILSVDSGGRVFRTDISTYYLKISNGAKSPFQVLTLANAADSSIAWYIRNGWNAKYTLTKDVSLMIPDVSHGDSGTLLLIEDASGTWKMNLPSNSFILSDASTITKTAGAKNFLTFVYDISTFYWNLGKNYIAQTQV